MRQHAASAIPAKLANGIYRFFPNSIVRMTHHDSRQADKASRSLQLLYQAAIQHVGLLICYMTNNIACQLRYF
jgi:hypothetical protein